MNDAPRDPDSRDAATGEAPPRRSVTVAGLYAAAVWAALPFVIAIGAVALWLALHLLAAAGEALLVFEPESERASEDLRNIAFLLAAVLGAPFVIWRALIAQTQAKAAAEQTRIANETNITGRINEAIRMLGETRTVKVRRRLSAWRLKDMPEAPLRRDF